jgi:hypothetical protein
MLLVSEAGGVVTLLDRRDEGGEGALVAGRALHPGLELLVEAAFRPSNQLH